MSFESDFSAREELGPCNFILSFSDIDDHEEFERFVKSKPNNPVTQAAPNRSGCNIIGWCENDHMIL